MDAKFIITFEGIIKADDYVNECCVGRGRGRWRGRGGGRGRGRDLRSDGVPVQAVA